MHKGGGQEARVCSRCFARADALRGSSPQCMSCGAPFPVAMPAYGAMPMGHPGMPRKSSSSALWWVLGIAGGFLLLSGLGVGILVVATASQVQDSSLTTSAATVTAPTETATFVPVVPTAPTVTADPFATAIPSATAVASAGAKPVAAPLSPAELEELSGNYTCSMDDTPPFQCRIANNVLEKLGGSQRFRGPVTKLSGGNFSFSGTFFCPFGACDHPVATTFIRQSPGRYVGKFGPNSVPGGGPGGERVVLTKVR
jgi:hypothetical protein